MAAVRSDPARRSVVPDAGGRRSVVPEAAGRSLWLAAVWTGVGAAAVCATLAIIAVAICWLPVSGASGRSMSAVRAGLLTFLAALHGGVTVDGTSAQFLPLGLTVIVGLTAWRAGAGLGDAATSLDEQGIGRLGIAALAQAGSFTLAALVALPFAHLGTSRAPILGVALAGFLLFAVTGGVAFARASALGDWISGQLPAFLPSVARAAGGAVAVYLGAGAFVVAVSLLTHLSHVEALSRQVGGGWGGVPIVLLGILSAPNAAIAAASYLIGPGFAVGSGAPVNAVTTTHGVVPAFPILGALPQGHGATALMWAVIAATAVVAGVLVARCAAHAESWQARVRDLGASAAVAAVLMFVLAWQGGGGIGAGRLSVLGASPWRVALFVGAQLTLTASIALACSAAWARGQRRRNVRDEEIGTVLGWLARNDFDAKPTVADAKPTVARVAKSTRSAEPNEKDKLAG
ncbi:MAG: DUF6350 family protein [Actinomycetota bacterium]|nr:DUF6350 family protein [Actinomycetota bacterium]